MGLLYHFGRYVLFLNRVFSKPEKLRIFVKQVFKEADSLGVGSIGIVSIISFFMGAVITLQTAYNLDLVFIPKYTIGLAARESVLLEFSSTIVGLILAGKVGSNIASEIGSMRVSEQIDAIEIMGINSSSYLVLPKIIALVGMIPFITLISMGIGIFGGWLAGAVTGEVPSADFIYGVQFGFKPFYIFYAIIKSVVFAFLISSISAYHGYYVDGGSLEVGAASTRAVVVSSIQILLFNLLLTQLLLA
ncbi:phospholipid/cholesterol/gamma-HCH transport system permease protein [Saccharicrinis carchari]|uniref:Phospholipid/cholesterol/gamma-HCH transport system permease protein n=1 Tax=Saccharicrinis carchari TaxID=1168039 RepID=A0A521CUF3_SACCC|nr:ABC transporter permease [Saccharicrinis carchari]SMO62290.1 phospholipid/cholesterol/gamma-HCH transport system permease protein [Saccharicrinis carchari]